MKKYTRREMLRLLGATTLFSTVLGNSGFATMAFANSTTISKETRSLMDTLVSIEVRHPSSAKRAEALSQAFSAIENAIAIVDRYDATSPIAHLNATGKVSNAPKELLDILSITKLYAQSTNELFNVTVQPLVDFLLNGKTPSKAEYKEVHALVKKTSDIHIQNSTISLAHKGMGITLDGIAKGYIVDIAGKILKEQNIEHYMINAGGDIIAQGQQEEGIAWHIGIQSPTHKNAIIHEIALSSGAIATSGGYERFNPNNTHYTHLINPYTAKSPNTILSASVIAPSTTQADALSTSISMMQPLMATRFIEQFADCACCIVTPQGITTSSRWNSFRV